MLQNKDKQRIFILAGESSGDLHASYLMQSLKSQNHKIAFLGIGGPNMEQEGLQSLVKLKNLAVMGFWEVIKKYRFFINLEKLILKNIADKKPDKIILVDYPGLNLRLAKKIKQNHNIPIFYYISPQLWAWKEKRINIIKKYVNHMIVIFPFEKAWYLKRGLDVQYFGHPIIKQIEKLNLNKKITENFSLRTIALLPGSREQEINKHLPVFLSLIKKHKTLNPSVNFIISCASNINKDCFDDFKTLGVKIDSRPLSKICNESDLAIVASGTATLECAMYNIPMIVVYRMSALSWLITKYFIKVKFASIVNILNEKLLVAELLQSNLSTNNLITEINKINNKEHLNTIYFGYNKIKQLLGDGTAYIGAANYINTH